MIRATAPLSSRMLKDPPVGSLRIKVLNFFAASNTSHPLLQHDIQLALPLFPILHRLFPNNYYPIPYCGIWSNSRTECHSPARIPGEYMRMHMCFFVQCTTDLLTAKRFSRSERSGSTSKHIQAHNETPLSITIESLPQPVDVAPYGTLTARQPYNRQ